MRWSSSTSRILFISQIFVRLPSDTDTNDSIVAGQCAAYGAQQRRRIAWFFKKTGGAHLQCRVAQSRFPARREKNDRRIIHAVTRKMFEQGESQSTRHPDVRQDECRSM